MGIQCGVLTDRHVKRLQFVTNRSTDGEEINAMLLCWPPSTGCPCFNETTGGIYQTLGGANTKTMLEVEKDLAYKNIIKKFKKK